MLVENIHIAILGPVSAGKSTFFNSLCSNTMSDMMRKKTTMLPQIYKIIDDDCERDVGAIYEKNKESNEKILALRESGEFDICRDFTELIHTMNPIPDFIQLPDTNATYSILDMPGLNCGGDTLYYDYIKKISSTIDIYLLVFDINSALNTTDEINILKLVVEQILKNNNGYVHILINKCDNIKFDGGVVNLQDRELNQLYESCIEIILKHCEKIVSKVSISPLCSNKLYTYRCIKNNIATIDEGHLDFLIKEEYGNSTLAKLTNISEKRECVSELVKLSIYDSWINNTGYNQFIYTLDNVLKNYPEMVFYHINSDVIALHKDPIDFDIIYDKIDVINMRIKRALNYSINGINSPPQYLIDNLDIINKKLNSHILAKYSQSSVTTIDGILVKVNKYCTMLKNIFAVNEIEKSEAQLSEIRISTIENEFRNEFNYDMFIELCNSGRDGWSNFGDGNKDFDRKILNDSDSYSSFKCSINSTLDKSMESIIELAHFMQTDIIYYSILIDIFVNKLQKNKINTEIFLQFLPKLVIHFNDDLVSISKTIINFISTNLSIIVDVNKWNYTNIICSYWKFLNSTEIKHSSKKIQYIYFISYDIFGIHDIHSSFRKDIFNIIDFDAYSRITFILDSIFEILSSILNTLESDSNSEISNNDINEQLSLTELRDKCKQLNLKGYSKKNKPQLLQLLQNK